MSTPVGLPGALVTWGENTGVWSQYGEGILVPLAKDFAPSGCWAVE
ncbi:MAG: hypothetical protein OXC41_02825 [Gammaproteobacteria bacterium]|nr:hypothetical protein [Gammaproteobacteria bacterium]